MSGILVPRWSSQCHDERVHLKRKYCSRVSCPRIRQQPIPTTERQSRHCIPSHRIFDLSQRSSVSWNSVSEFCEINTLQELAMLKRNFLWEHTCSNVDFIQSRWHDEKTQPTSKRVSRHSGIKGILSCALLRLSISSASLVTNDSVDHGMQATKIDGTRRQCLIMSSLEQSMSSVRLHFVTWIKKFLTTRLSNSI